MKRGAFLVAVLAALLFGAPSVALAAPPNRLETASAERVGGTPPTVFRLSVRYVSSAGNPAWSVTARVGPLEVPLTLADGTVIDGTWSGTVMLPAGTWPLSYHAGTSKAPKPSLDGPTLTVGEAIGGKPSSAPQGNPVEEEPSPTSSSVADSADRSAGPSESPLAGPEAPGTHGTRSRQPQSAPTGASHRPSAHVTPEPAPGKSRRRSDNRGRRGGAAPVTRTPNPSVAEEDAPLAVEPGGDERDDLLLLIAIVGVATITLLGTGWLLGAREAATSESALAEARERAARRRRARRVQGEGAVHPAHDPVLAALGLEPANEGPPDPTRGVARGAAPRPRKAPPARR